ncbi:MAG TPA: sulfotransferase domain-containing protein, partial [Bacteroidia bacterium]|nr:sulfotransferase domain-containing protein [Bacteroidia bacterium]
ERTHGSLNFPFSEIRSLIEDHHSGKSYGWEYKMLVDLSIYHRHLETIFRYFPKERVHIFLFEELVRQPADVCGKLFRELGVDEDFRPDTSVQYNVTKEIHSHKYARFVKRILRRENPLKKAVGVLLPGKTNYRIGEFLRRLNKKDIKPEMIDAESRKFLLDYFRPHNDILAEMIGRDLSSWNS